MRWIQCLIVSVSLLSLAALPPASAAEPGLKAQKSTKSKKIRQKNTAAEAVAVDPTPFAIPAADGVKAAKNTDAKGVAAAADVIDPKPFPIPAADGAKPGEATTIAPDAAPSPPPVWPKTLEDAKAPAAPPPPAWTEQEIAAAKAECTDILKRIDAVAIPEAPIREGICGAPAPIQLISIGKNPEVALSPPATVTCPMAEMLHTWLKTDLQPLALKRLGAEIIRIQTMSSYQCRMAYGRSTNKLSEHGVANALDIGAFTLSSGKTASVLKDWGPNNRDIAAALEAEKAAALAEEAKRLAAEGPGGAAAAAPQKKNDPKVAGIVVTEPEGSERRHGRLGYGQGPDRLGGPTMGPKTVKAEKTAADATIYFKPGNFKDGASSGVITPPEPKAERKSAKALMDPLADGGIPRDDGRMAFLKDAHEAACKLFGTTLGPEANEAHRNHFHVDMAPRKFKKICD